MKSSKEMQLWQQHLLQKQLQEIQRQQQLQQLERGARQQNLLGQGATPRQTVQNQLPPLLNGMPINNASSYMLQNDIMSGEPKTPNSSHLFMMPNHHGQAMHTHLMGFAPQQQFDQSLYGTPVSSNRGLTNQYPQFQGMPTNYVDAMAKGSMHSVPQQRIQAQEIQNFSQTNWSNNVEQTAVSHVPPSRTATCLDPEEEKILFGTNDGGNFGSFLNDDSIEGSDQFSAFPSLQSGSWSALMQDAVQSSSSDKGFQEEWSGLSFQKPDSLIANNNQATWDNNSVNSHNASIRPSPLFNEPNVKQIFNGGIQPQIQSNDVNCSVWPGNMHEHKSNQGNWNHQENKPLSSISNQADSNRTTFVQNGVNSATVMEQSQFNTISSQPQPIPFSTNNLNSNQETSQHASNRYHADHGKHVAFDSFMRSRGGENVEEYKHQRSQGQQIQDSSMNSASPSISDSQTSSGMSGWKSVGPHKFQSPKDTAHSQSIPKSAIQQIKSQEQAYVENSHMRKGNANSPEELQYRSSVPTPISNNMVELLNQVDISVPPSQNQENHDLHSRTSLLDFNRKQLDSKSENKDQMQSAGSDHSLHHPKGASQRGNLEVRSDISGQKRKELSQIISQGNSSANNTSNLSYMGRQLQMWKQQQLLQQQQILQQRHISNITKPVEDHVNHTSLLRQAQMSQNAAIASQSAQTSLPNIAGRVLPFKLEPSVYLNTIHHLKSVHAQQIDSPKMLHNVWTSASTRGSTEHGTFSQNIQQSIEGDKIPIEETPFNGTHSETCSASQEQEKVLKDCSDINSTKQSNVPSIVQQQPQQPNFSLPKQMQAIKGSDSRSLDDKMLSFSSGTNEEKSAEKTVLTVQTHTQPPSSTSHYMSKSEHSPLTPQMARSWFEQYRKYKNGQFVAVSQNMLVNNRAANESSPQLQLGINDEMSVRPKKRKIETSEILPWHQVVSLGVQRLQNISMAEHGWAWATNRLVEKVEDVAELMEDGSLMPRARRRLTLTSQLMQKLLPPVPASILAAKVASAYESITYFLAKQALGDACSFISSYSGEEKENRASEKHKASEKPNEVFFSEVAEEFAGRSKKLESVFSRLDKRTSILETRLEWQEVEKFSLINRLGKIHARNQQADGAESTSTSQNAPQKILPQRYVSAFSTANVPQGVQCLLL